MRPSLDSAENRHALEQLAGSLSDRPPVRSAGEQPAVLQQLMLSIRELIACACSIDFHDHGLRASIIVNHGHAAQLGTITRITPCQTVAVLLPNAAVSHPLARVPGSIYYSHVALASNVTTLTAPLYVDRLWTVRGNVSPVLPRGYSFMGCVDGILYAMTDSPVFDPAAGLAALAELVRLADLPWQPPMPVARAQAIQASAANAQRLMRGQLLPLAIALLALAVVPMVISVVRSLLP